MLKIKDNVELEDLEKITNIVVDDDWIWIDENEQICIDRNTRVITIYADYDEGNQFIDVLYDLIKADLVEKI